MSKKFNNFEYESYDGFDDDGYGYKGPNEESVVYFEDYQMEHDGVDYSLDGWVKLRGDDLVGVHVENLYFMGKKFEHSATVGLVYSEVDWQTLEDESLISELQKVLLSSQEFYNYIIDLEY